MSEAIRILAAQPWVERLGWTLLHFLWQGVAIAAVYGTARFGIGRRWSANERYLLACAALGAMLAAPVVTWISLQPPASLPDPAYRIASAPASLSHMALAQDLRADVRDGRAPDVLPWVVVAWLAGAAGFSIRLACGCFIAAHLKFTAARRAPLEWQQILARLAARIGVCRRVGLVVSAVVHVPTVVGWLRPVVLVPVGALGGIPAEHLEALLLHELAHIRRHDYLVNVLQSIAEALLFYHPAVWWISGHIRREREMCCDDAAVAATGDAFTYAHALTDLEARRPAYLKAALAGDGGSLSERIAHLLGQPRPRHLQPRSGIAALLFLLAAAGIGLFAQADPRPSFETASIKRHEDGPRRAMGVRVNPGGRLTSTDAPLVLLIQNAYRLQAFQVAGGPGWINSDGYDIEAKPGRPAEDKQVWTMLQSLLADRFRLTVHRETRELPAYALTVAKSGPKLPPPKQEGCVADSLYVPPTRDAAPACGSIRITMSPAGLQLLGLKTDTAELTRILSIVLGKPVVDRTGFTGRFDVQMSFTPDENTMGLPGAGGPHDPGGFGPVASDPNRPNVFAAVEEQLGLKLASSKAPVEVLVIDHVERPTAN